MKRIYTTVVTAFFLFIGFHASAQDLVINNQTDCEVMIDTYTEDCADWARYEPVMGIGPWFSAPLLSWSDINWRPFNNLGFPLIATPPSPPYNWEWSHVIVTFPANGNSVTVGGLNAKGYQTPADCLGYYTPVGTTEDCQGTPRTVQLSVMPGNVWYIEIL